MFSAALACLHYYMFQPIYLQQSPFQCFLPFFITLVILSRSFVDFVGVVFLTVLFATTPVLFTVLLVTASVLFTVLLVTASVVLLVVFLFVDGLATFLDAFFHF